MASPSRLRRALRLLLLVAPIGGAVLLAALLRRLQLRALRTGQALQARRLARLAARRTVLQQRAAAAASTLRIVVLGGGVGGLAAAWTLARALRRLQPRPGTDSASAPRHQVVLLEAQNQPGGQVRTLQAAAGVAPALAQPLRLETGPRSLRTTTEAATVALRLLAALDAAPLVRWAESSTRSRRYVRTEDGRGLEPLPTSLASALAFAWRWGLGRAILRDLCHVTRPVPLPAQFARNRAANGNGSSNRADQSLSEPTVHEFVAEHFSPALASRYASALVHGVFSGDSRQLLLRYAFPSLWRLAAAYGSVALGSILDGWLHWSQQYADAEAREVPPSAATLDTLWGPLAKPEEFEKLLKRAQRERVASLEGGLSTLVTALYDAARDEDVELRLGVTATSLVSQETQNNPSYAQVASTHATGSPVKPASHATAAGTHASTTLTAATSGVPTPPTSRGDKQQQASGPSRPAVAVHCSDGQVIHADVVVSTLPPNELHELLESSATLRAAAAPAHARAQAAVANLARVTSLSIAVVSFVFHPLTFEEATKEAGDAVAPGFGFLTPASEDRGLLLGVIFDSCVFPALAGAKTLVLSAMLGGADVEAQREVEQLTDQQLIERGWHAVQTHLGVRAAAELTRLTRWHRAIPQFDATYARARGDLDEWIAVAAPWLFVAGKAFGSGVGVNDSIASCVHAAADVMHALGFIKDL